MQYSQNCQALVGRLLKQRAGLDALLARDLLNDRIRTILDRRPVWAGLFRRTVIPIPNQYNAGTVSLQTGSKIVTGVGTNWPVSDVVNTVINEAVTQPQTVWVTPASLDNITKNTVLYVDAAGPYPEVVPILDKLANRILCSFNFPHDRGFTATCSSLAGLQFRMNSTNPVFTVNAVSSDTTLILDTPWGSVTTGGQAYQILLMYTPIADDVKDLMIVTDPVQQIKLRIHVSQAEVNQYDPNRTATDSPTSICDFGPNLNGNQMYEIYPPQATQRQLWVLYHKQWPDMRLPTDYPPPFINPSVIAYGALADAYVTPCGRAPDYKDPGYSPQAAEKYMAMFEAGILDCINADESKYQQAFQFDVEQLLGYGMGAYWEQRHDYQAVLGEY